MVITLQRSAPTGSMAHQRKTQCFVWHVNTSFLTKSQCLKKIRPLFVPNWFTSSGRKLRPEKLRPVVEFFINLLKRSQQFHDSGGEPLPSVGEFVKAEVERLAPEEWKEDQANTALRLGMINTLLKLECCVSGTHTMDDVGLIGLM
ncbi:peroxisomal N(1)-acetyl-spermine/spermidine oxidase-like [Onychostoma macrolepis]|uniref:peroxisomal N(1)-acetyl-spermine/spermidine oxidase-like n=1 Tax=Onychostoma macrolepis TaxID=369639 RepID=UPI00272C7245|nr:peroxisomal N(1)-acetyl-spermine/spermidine oxidase-like [Onychostoma macrolepis]